jgi:hypothetical protein
MQNKRILNTDARRKVKRSQDRATRNLSTRGWRHDGLWWHSPYTGTRYLKRDALHVEELRAWAESDSAFLNDKDHSMWVKKLEDDNALVTMDEASKRCRRTQELKRMAVL